MKTLRNSVSEQFIRCFTAAAVLFYVLVPQVAACQCNACRCSHHEKQVIKKAEPPKHSCCSRAAEKTSEPTQGEPVQGEREHCPCAFKVLNPTDRATLENGLKIQDNRTVEKLVPVCSLSPLRLSHFPVSRFSSHGSPPSALAVRLHLFYNVLLI
ncbi:MAG: hypothetical protein LBN39_00860 [Planctomycetaceae bacterium]|jgi:hypothetical protein|nr:hypothetical protein [Planctomycetaceae bacterium]